MRYVTCMLLQVIRDQIGLPGVAGQHPLVNRKLTVIFCDHQRNE
jgi:hypothetical protein